MTHTPQRRSIDSVTAGILAGLRAPAGATLAKRIQDTDRAAAALRAFEEREREHIRQQIRRLSDKSDALRRQADAARSEQERDGLIRKANQCYAAKQALAAKLRERNARSGVKR